MTEYNTETIINGEKIRLTDEEKKNVTLFHNSRIAFTIRYNENKIPELLTNKHDEREHRVYLEEDYGIQYDEYEKMIRGYIKPGKIMFYVSSAFLPAERDDLTTKIMNMAFELAIDSFGIGTYEIYNGVEIGVIGVDWVGKEHIATFTRYM